MNNCNQEEEERQRLIAGIPGKDKIYMDETGVCEIMGDESVSSPYLTPYQTLGACCAKKAQMYEKAMREGDRETLRNLMGNPDLCAEACDEDKLVCDPQSIGIKAKRDTSTYYDLFMQHGGTCIMKDRNGKIVCTGSGCPTGPVPKPHHQACKKVGQSCKMANPMGNVKDGKCVKNEGGFECKPHGFGQNVISGPSGQQKKKPSPSSSGKGMSTGEIIGISAGSVVGLGLLVTIGMAIAK